MKLIDCLGRLICPPACVCCKLVFDFNSNDALCNSCYEAVLYRILDVARQEEIEYVDRCYYFLNYRSWYAKKLIRHIKYVGSKELLRYIGVWGKASLDKHNLMLKIDLITFTPRRKHQVTLYGFDQAEEIAKAISRETLIPCRKLLERTGFSFEQKSLKKKKREKNVIGKFKCTQPLKGKRILLVDDVITTGSTVSECAKMLKSQGAKEVYVWAFAQ